jgi:cysteinyl-tRNA synthetase
MRYLGETFDIHGGGMDLVFPHHENETAQSECATGKPFCHIWMHHGLTKVNTKKISKSDADPEMQAALMRMTLHNLLEEYPGELMRFFVLSTHYRRPIEYSEAEIESKRKGLVTFYRLFERIERIAGHSPYDGATLDAPVTDDVLAKVCEEQSALFHQAMDDDFNTAGAIATFFELATAINRYVEENKIESGGTDAAKGEALNATRRLIATARLIGLFLEPQARKAGGDDALTDKVMQVLIEVRQHVRKNKDFTTADLIRDRLKDAGITLEDRPDGTLWRTE